MSVVHHSAICTSDLETSLRFWRDGLGFVVLMDQTFTGDWPTLFDAPSDRLRAVFLGDPAHPDAGIVELVVFDEPEGAPAERSPESGTGAVLLLSVLTDVDTALARFDELGLDVDARRTEVHGVAMAAVRDPNGVRVELVGTGGAANLDRLRTSSGRDDRVVGDAVDVDYDHTRRFFENRAVRAGEVSDAQVTTFQDREPGLAERREAAERAKVLPLLDVHLGCRVLDLGCGSGRWAWPLVGEIDAYLGVDFSAGLVDLARAEAARRGLEDVCRFETMSLVDLDPDALPLAPPFDRVLVVGVLMYMNDDDVDRILGQLDGLVAPGGRLYLTEPIGRTDRLTLVDHQSDELGDTYSAIYRTRVDYEQRVARLLPDLTCIDAGPLYPPELENRAETQQFSWVFRRDR